MTTEFGYCRDCKHWQTAKKTNSTHRICLKLTAFLELTVDGGRYSSRIDPVEVPAYFGCSIFEKSEN
jgi:hypothetical protein